MWEYRCDCIPKNAFIFYNGRWYTESEHSRITKQDNHHMLSFSGQLTNFDFVKDLIWNVLLSLIILGAISTGVFFAAKAIGGGLKSSQVEQMK